jgi:molecular chaperone DnaK (HSP70)
VSLGKLRFTDIPAAPAGEPDLIVSVMITATSVMKCTGSINGQKKEMVLDLTGETGVADEKQDKDAALIKRWRKAAEKMDEKAAEGLNRLIDGYPTISSKKDIMSYIRDNGHELKTEQ